MKIQITYTSLFALPVIVLSWGFLHAAPQRPAEVGVTGQVAAGRLVAEVKAGLERRNLQPRFSLLRNFMGERLDASAGSKTFSDKTGNSRLQWFDSLLRRPVESITESEAFTRSLHQTAATERGGVYSLLAEAARKLDALPASGRWPAPRSLNLRNTGARLTASPEAPAMQHLRACLAASRAAWDQAIQPLSATERAELEQHAYEQTTGGLTLGHRYADRERGRRVSDLLEKMSRPSLLEAAAQLAPLAEPEFLQQMARVRVRAGGAALAGVQGSAQQISTAQGNIILGGPGANRYDLENLSTVCAVVDLGGDDTYLEGTVSAARPQLVILDLAGNDVYRGIKPGIQGAAILGVSLLVDSAGNDVYDGQDLAQGACLGGVGMLIDRAGNDSYRALRRGQGSAIAGPALLLDRAGNDRYHAALLAQGCGGPLGFGLLDDVSGDDHYFAGGKYSGGYDDSPGFGSFSQGVGVGPRGTANGGIGIILDGAGADVYESDGFGHGGGYWFAVGIARDFGGNDRYEGATFKNYEGGERSDPKHARFVRWGLGYGCHYALGFFFDDAGDDFYGGDMACLGFAWDLAVGVVCDAGGNDQYTATGSSQGTAANAGLAVLYDGGGDDVYKGATQGMAAAAVDYHPADQAGGNFAFLIDHGGKDTYAEATLGDDRELERGWAGGFFLDRPGPGPLVKAP